MKVLSPFGPKIAVIKIPLNLVKKINDEVESIIKDKKKSKSNDYSKKLVGQVEQEIELKNKFIKKNLKSFISKSVNQYLKGITKYGPIQKWNTRLVTNMDGLFKDKTEFK